MPCQLGFSACGGRAPEDGVRQYDRAGCRTTDCCGAHCAETASGGFLCLTCHRPVQPGEGDGTEWRSLSHEFPDGQLNRHLAERLRVAITDEIYCAEHLIPEQGGDRRDALAAQIIAAVQPIILELGARISTQHERRDDECNH